MARRQWITGTATNTDCIAGTVLENLGPGLYRFWVASSVVTCTLSVTSMGVPLLNAKLVPAENSTIPEVKPNELPSFDIVHKGPGNPTVVIAGTTGTWCMWMEKPDAPPLGA